MSSGTFKPPNRGFDTMEEYAYILDNMPMSTPSKFGKGAGEPVCYAIGESEFKLFELVPKAGAIVNIGDRVFIGKDDAKQKRDVIDHVKRRIKYDELSGTAVTELEYAISDIVVANQDKFIRFFNESQAISLRKHALQELPKLGTAARDLILAERAKAPFKDFADMSARLGPKIKNPEKFIVDRIKLEISDSERKHYLFVSQ